MRRFLSNIAAVTAISLLAGVVGTMAQQTAHVAIDVPFDFMAGSKLMGAGTYDVKVTRNTSGGAYVLLVSEDKDIFANLLGRTCGDTTRHPSNITFTSRDGAARSIESMTVGDFVICIQNSKRPSSNLQLSTQAGL